MSVPQSFPLVAVDIGNSRIKLGLFERSLAATGLPTPCRTLAIETEGWDPVEIALWLAPLAPAAVNWSLASVHGRATERMRKWLQSEAPDAAVRELSHEDLPLVVDLPAPDKVGIDRLLAAVAANRVRPSDRAAVVIDLGTAITVDVVSREGTFCGGSILPGLEMSRRALGQYADQLPLPPAEQIQSGEPADPPPALGTSTDEAIASGLFWGAVGAVRILVEQLNKDMQEQPFIVLSGGNASRVAAALGVQVHYEPYLLLAGIALAAGE